MKKISILFISLLFLLSGCDNNEPETAPNIDLTAESLEFSLEKTDELEGNVTISGTIKNIGEDYRSNEGQQTIQLVEKPAAGQAEVLATKKFKDLDAGATLEITHVIQGWRASQEFPPSFILRISFDPDLFIDGNTHNDDSNEHNNSLEKPGQEINQFF